jgi:hypothetical protein
MDNEPSILEPPVDRTPYGAFWYVAVICLAFFIGGSVFLWHLAGNAKRNQWFHLPKLFSGSSATAFPLFIPAKQIEDTTKQNVQDLTNRSINEAKQGASEAVQNEVDSQLKQLQNSVNSPQP